jgi:glucosamine-phosphate N-acetyltransferase
MNVKKGTKKKELKKSHYLQLIKMMSDFMYNIRHLECNDNLSLINDVLLISEKNNNKLHDFISELNENHRVFVVEIKINETDCAIIGIGTIFIEKKIIHSFGKVGHIEDIVIAKSYRGVGLGKILINYLVNYGKEKGCYKVILNCSAENIKFYEKCGLSLKANQMAIYF